MHNFSVQNDHKWIEYLNDKIQVLHDERKIQEIEFNEKLRIRDIKIKSLTNQQRQLWKWLNRLERALYWNKCNIKFSSSHS